MLYPLSYGRNAVNTTGKPFPVCVAASTPVKPVAVSYRSAVEP